MNNRRGIKSLIFIDGGDPQETAEAKKLLGFIDGQTTNPTLVSKNPEVKKFIESGKKFTEEDLLKEYRRIVQEVAKATQGPCSIETHASENTSAEELLSQARGMFTWIPNAYIKFPTIPAGLEASQRAVAEGIRVNMTLVFSQEQAAAVYAATKFGRPKPLPGFFEDSSPVYVSPFVGRLDDRGENGMDVVVNILEMYRGRGLSRVPQSGILREDGHVHVLTASVRNLEHLLFALKLESQAITVPFSVFKQWADVGFKLPDKDYIYNPKFDIGKELVEIPYHEMTLDKNWAEYNIKHPLTDRGLAQFANDWEGLLASS